MCVAVLNASRHHLDGFFLLHFVLASTLFCLVFLLAFFIHTTLILFNTVIWNSSFGNYILLEFGSTEGKNQDQAWLLECHTMYETGRLAQVTTEMRRYKLHMLGVSESRWTGTGRLKLVSGETVLYSG